MLLNLGDPADWNGEQFFADMILTARTPGSVSTPQDEKYWDRHNCGPDGWPLEDFGIIIAEYNGSQTRPGHLTGTYTLSFTGVASVSTVACAGVTLSPITTSNGVCSCTLTCDPAAFRIWLAFTGTHQVQNVKLLRASSIVNPKAKAALLPFEGIRWMCQQGTNQCTQREWSDRPKMGDAPRHYNVGQVPKDIDIWQRENYLGVPLETMIDACRELNISGWFSVPDMASDDCVQQMASLFAARWTHGKPLYIQWSNEIGWNGQFSQTTRLQNKFNSNWQQMMAYIATRTVEIGDIFKAAKVPGLKVVLAGQLSNPDWLQTGLAAIPKGSVDAIAGAAYFTTPDEINSWGKQAFAAHHDLASQNGIEFYLYEYGVESKTLPGLRNDPSSKPFLTAMVDAWNQSVPKGHSGTACYFALGGGGYGILEYLDAPTVAFKALTDALSPVATPYAETPPMTNIPIPLEDLLAHPKSTGGVLTNNGVRTFISFKGTGSLSYVLPNDFQAGFYAFRLTTRTDKPRKVCVGIYVDGEKVHMVYGFPDQDELAFFAYFYKLRAGMTLRIEATDPGLLLYGAQLNPLNVGA